MDLIEKYNETNLFGKENNLELKVVSPGHIEYTMALEDKHMALPNVVHGGVLAGMMDAVLSVAAFSAVAEEGKHVATVEFKINYLKAVRNKQMLRGIGKVIKKGSRIIFVNGEIRDSGDTIVATSTGTIMPYDNK